MPKDAELLALWERWKALFWEWGEQTDEGVAKDLFLRGEAVMGEIATKRAEGLDGLAIQYGLYFYYRDPSLDPHSEPLADAIKDALVRMTGIDAHGEALAIAESPSDRRELQ